MRYWETDLFPCNIHINFYHIFYKQARHWHLQFIRDTVLKGIALEEHSRLTHRLDRADGKDYSKNERHKGGVSVKKKQNLRRNNRSIQF